MASSYPGALDSFTNPTSTDAMDASAALYHDVQHANINDAVEAVQAELGTDPAGAQATVKARLEAAQSVVLSQVSWASGAYLLTSRAPGSAQTQTMSVNTCAYGPWWCPVSVTLDRVALEVTTLQANANARIGLYGATSSGGVGSLIADLGEVDCSSTGVKELTISQQVEGGRLYYWALLNETTGVGYRVTPLAAVTPMGLLSGTASTSLSHRASETVTYSSGFPSTATPTLDAATVYGLLLWLRRT